MKIQQQRGERMTPTNNLKRLGVILITDNREKNTTDRSFVIDYRCSAFKQTEVDPLEYTQNYANVFNDDGLFAELSRRVGMLEERVQVLSNSDARQIQQQNEKDKIKKKNRRKFKELVRNQRCAYCNKNYGSETSLKYHIKLKHGEHQGQNNKD